ncbi:MAG: hypothetical protein RIG63_09020 [Coleofasciculus chthonoplastes F3-SA18-01]
MSSPLIAMANRSIFFRVAQVKLSRGSDGLAQPHGIKFPLN